MRSALVELKSAGLAHLPSGKFPANAAWLGLATLAHNLGRAVGILTGGPLARATAATLRHRLFTSQADSSAPPAGCGCGYPPTGPGSTTSRPR